MEDNLNKQAADSEQIRARTLLKLARERTHISPHDLSRHVGNSVSAYRDLENCDGDIYMTISLRALSEICFALGMTAKDLFVESNCESQPITMEELCKTIKNYLNTANLSVSAFEEKVGFEIEASLKNPYMVYDWNVDCLRFVCNEIGIDWRMALPVAPPK